MGIQLAFFPQSLTRSCIRTMQLVLSEMRTKGRTNHLGDIFCTQEERANSTGLESYMDFEASVMRAVRNNPRVPAWRVKKEAVQAMASIKSEF